MGSSSGTGVKTNFFFKKKRESRNHTLLSKAGLGCYGYSLCWEEPFLVFPLLGACANPELHLFAGSGPLARIKRLVYNKLQLSTLRLQENNNFPIDTSTQPPKLAETRRGFS